MHIHMDTLILGGLMLLLFNFVHVVPHPRQCHIRTLCAKHLDRADLFHFYATCSPVPYRNLEILIGLIILVMMLPLSHHDQ